MGNFFYQKTNCCVYEKKKYERERQEEKNI